MPMTLFNPTLLMLTKSATTNLKVLGLTLLTSLVLTACEPISNSDGINSDDNNASITTSVDTATANQADVSLTQPSSQSTSELQTSSQIIEQPVTILALGDSLTEGLGLAQEDAYPAQLQEALHDMGYVNATVINAGLSGETSSGLVNRLNWALKTDPDITILTIGANDAMRGIDAATVEQNLRTAIERLQESGSLVILGGMSIYDNLGDDYVTAFSDIYPKLAKEYDVAFIPFFLEGVGGVAKLNQADAIHPTAEGYAHIINNNILPVLKPTLDDFVTDNEAAANNEASIAQ